MQREVDPGTGPRRETRDVILADAEQARKRIAEGVAMLEDDAEVLEAFRLANRAMALAARKRSPERYGDGKRPAWRLFQIAFLLLALPSLADKSHPDRETVELIFFPTGVLENSPLWLRLGSILFGALFFFIGGRFRQPLGIAAAMAFLAAGLALNGV